MPRPILAQCILQIVLGVLSCSLVDFIHTSSRGGAAEGNSDKRIDNLIADLGSDSFEIREAAMRTLKEKIEAISVLRKTRQTSDLEVRRRIDDILSVLERKRALRGLSKARALGKAGRAVEVADRLAVAAKYGAAGDEGWDSLTQFAEDMIDRTGLFFSPGWKSYCNRQLPVGEFRHFVRRINPKEIAGSLIEIDTGKKLDPKDIKMRAANDFIRDHFGKLIFRGEEVSLTGRAPLYQLGTGMIAASGDVQVSGAMNSIIVAGGNVRNVLFLANCFLICDGDVELLDGRGLRGSIIVARGKVILKQGKFWNCLVRSNHNLLLPNGKTIEIKDGTPNPFAFVKFFELADVGIAADDFSPREKADTAGVRLKEVRKESPFAAGLRAGDVITAIEEKKTPTTEIFRRVLRRKLAEGGPLLTFTVHRSGKTMDVSLPVKE